MYKLTIYTKYARIEYPVLTYDEVKNRLVLFNVSEITYELTKEN